MEKKYSSYETLFVVDLSLGGEGVRNLVSKFIGMMSENGVLTGVNEWGKRRLAYPINDKNEGYYVVATFNAPQAFPAELDRVFGITEGIMRFMTVVTEPKEAEAIVSARMSRSRPILSILWHGDSRRNSSAVTSTRDLRSALSAPCRPAPGPIRTDRSAMRPRWLPMR